MGQPSWTVFQCGIGIIILNFLVVSIYRLKFHPLAKYPGPWLAKITDFYAAYYALLGQTHLCVYQVHQRYGGIVRLGPNKLCFESAAALHEIYTSKDVQKSKGYPAISLNQKALNTHTAVDKALHRRKRRLVSPAFSEQALRRFEPVMIEKVDVFVKELFSTVQRSGRSISSDGYSEHGDANWSSPIDLGFRFKHLTLDVLGEFGFGQSLDLQTSHRNRFFIDAIDAASFRGGIYAQYSKLRRYGFDLIILGLKKGLWGRFIRLNRELVAARLGNSEAEKHDLFSFLVDVKDPKTGWMPSPQELFGESALFIIAGTDTTATALSATLFYLSKHPSCYNKAVSDIRGAFKHPSEIKISPELTKITYLRACIDEAMRMSPPVGAALWREVCSPKGTTIEGTFVPPGIDVGSSIYSVHHDRRIFPQPFLYKPERWMEEECNAANQLEAMRLAFQPFSIGTRSCVAKNMAYMELSITIAKLLWNFDICISSEEGSKDSSEYDEQFELKEHLTAKYKGPWLQLRGRPGVETEM